MGKTFPSEKASKIENGLWLMGRSLGLSSILCLLVNDACHIFDYLLCFLDALVVKSVAEFIPLFLLGFLMMEWPRHDLTMPGAF